ncbi:MAG: phosphopantetheine-binding protein, partial [Candidatus Binatia bacterium]
VPLGRPLPNTQVYVLDTNLRPVPIGVPGELHIGGRCLARGYLDRPEATAEKFVPNPFGNEPGARLYKTGDLGRYLSDGNIEFLGRTDHQVKIRGFRIEPGEIESALAQHPAVREAVVVAREDARAELDAAENRKSDKRLVAYVVPHRNLSPPAGELRSYLKEKLPDPMVPSAFVLLDVLPRTPHGKLDRRALPEPDQSRPELEENLAAPRTPVEEAIVEIWREVLSLDRVGVHDNFFELGGHSLLATQVISRLREAFQVELPLRSLFERPTIAGLADQVDIVLWAGKKPQTGHDSESEETEEIKP